MLIAYKIRRLAENTVLILTNPPDRPYRYFIQHANQEAAWSRCFWLFISIKYIAWGQDMSPAYADPQTGLLEAGFCAPYSAQ
jgi:hypothetical protein